MSLLQAEGLTKKFSGLTAVDDVSLTVADKEFFGVVGPNGAGKTTLFSLIAGEVTPTHGRIIFDGTDITGWSADKVASVGLVRTFQLMRPFESMTVLDNVAIASHQRFRSRSEARRHALAVIERVQLERYVNAPSASLPTAGLKRLELARALALEPKLLLLDEVLAGLVPTERAPMIELLRELHADGLTVMFIEHIMAAVLALSERLLVMHEGVELALGDPHKVTQDRAVVEAYLGEDYA
ncbi:ABC transporter ATP-binding protein [Qaidamihabitans albus]|uniref:ABC transporter ATP-binding protein n=1 Tax=Qaidamihabitans albus TaxID=2795733 RepID=UPI001B356862|nr:ABC transporter ATP-binding protein [Qaidamihabitans albus]